MIRLQRRHLACSALAFLLLTITVRVDAQEAIPVATDEAAKIIERADAYYKGLPAFSAFAEVGVVLPGAGIDNTVGMRAVMQRPNTLSIMAIEPDGYFPTNQFVSDGTDLFESSIRRQMFMISAAPSTMQGLFHRVSRRSAPNMPVEVLVALMSDRPIENVLRLDVEPGLIRVIGQELIDGVVCDHLQVNADGASIWIRAQSPNWVMRYRNSPIIAQPRYLPAGAKVTGPTIEIDFKAWTSSVTNPDWSWKVPEGYVQMATMHESADGGPEDGYTSLLMSENTGQPAGIGSGVGRLTTSPGGEDPRKPLTGIPVGTTAPDVELFRIDGQRTTLEATRADKPAALIFWMNRNKFSRTGVPKLVNALEPFGQTCSLLLIGAGESEESVKNMIKRNEAFAGSFVDRAHLASNAFGVKDVFAVVLLDHEGKVSDVAIGQDPRLIPSTTNKMKALIAAATEASADAEDGTTDAVEETPETGPEGTPDSP